ncbi:MAG: tRNA 2-thiouridine(34) synthase MnmA [Flammeovirgaceae bacterium]
MKQRVVVGLSGGVDSSVAAYLLLQQGYEVIGMFMRNWHDDSVTINNECPWVDDSNDALMVAQHLGIPFQTIDLSEDYKNRIVDYMFAEYKKGRTPNPDVLCNREIKFDIFLKAAMSLNADFVATGHYARKAVIEKDGKVVYRLLAGVDGNKDQSYFLCQLSQQQLSKALFPVGELTKPEVRQIAHKLGLVTADKKDSQGLCFVGKVRLPEFLQQQLKPKEGNVVEILPDAWVLNGEKKIFSSEKERIKYQSRSYHFSPNDGKVIGKHQGAHFYTIGQRKGLNIGGKPEPMFVIGIDTEQNVVYLGMGENHKGLLRDGLFVQKSDIHWVREDLTLAVGQSMQVKARIRYRQPLEDATLYQEEEGMYVIFKKPQKGIASGQFVAWHGWEDKGEELLGSGVIY